MTTLEDSMMNSTLNTTNAISVARRTSNLKMADYFKT